MEDFPRHKFGGALKFRAFDFDEPAQNFRLVAEVLSWYSLTFFCTVQDDIDQINIFRHRLAGDVLGEPPFSNTSPGFRQKRSLKRQRLDKRLSRLID